MPFYAKLTLKNPGNNVWIYPNQWAVADAYVEYLAPFVNYNKPADGILCADPDVNIVIDIVDDSLIAQDTIDAYVDGDWAYDGTSFKTGYDGAGSSIAPLSVGEYDGYRITIDATSSYSGEITVEIAADDAYGNSVSDSWSFTVDTTAPYLADTSPASGYSCPDVLISFDVLDDCNYVKEDSIDAYVDGYWAVRKGVFADAYDGASSSITATSVGDADGYTVVIDNISTYASSPVTVDAYAMDSYDNDLWDQWTFNIDYTAPSIDGYHPSSGVHCDNVSFYFDVTDTENAVREDTIDAYLDGTLAVYQGSFQGTYTGAISAITDGYRVHILQNDNSFSSGYVDAYAQDACGNQMGERKTVSIDSTEPWLDGYYPGGNTDENHQSYLIHFDVVDDYGVGREDIDAYVDGVWAFKGAVNTFVSPYDGSNSDAYEISGGWHICLDKTDNFDALATVTVDAYADDYCGNSFTEQWTFDVIDYGDIVYRVPFNVGGISQLPLKLTMNSNSEWPEICYDGVNAGDPTWTPTDSYGPNLTLLEFGSGGTKPTTGQGYPGLDSHESVRFYGGDASNKWIYVADDYTAGDLGTDDFVIEFVYKKEKGQASYGYPFGRRANANSGQGWEAECYGPDGRIKLQLDTGPAAANAGTSSGPYTWRHVMMFVNRDEASTNCYTQIENGSTVATGDLSSCSASITNPDAYFAIGARSQDGAVQDSSYIATVRIWKHPGWMQAGADGVAEALVIAKERFALLIGTAPDSTYSPADGYANTGTRTSDAVLEKTMDGASKYFEVGPRWIRVCRALQGDETDSYGVCVEEECENLVTYAEELDGNWTESNITLAQAGEAPYAQTINHSESATNRATSLTADTNDSTHYTYLEATVADATRYVLSVFGKASAKNWIKMKFAATSNAPEAYFNMNTGFVGATSNVDGYGIQKKGDDWWRAYFTWTSNAAESKNIEIHAANADGDDDWQGASELCCYVWCPQLEARTNGLPSSPIISRGSTTTRTADTLSYDISSKLPDGYVTMVHDFMSPDGYNKADGYMVTISDGDAGSDMAATKNTDGNFAEVDVFEGGVNTILITGDDDVNDGYEHEIRTILRNNQSSLYVNGVADGTDDSGIMSSGIDVLDINADVDGANNSSGIIGDVTFYDGYNLP